MKTRQFIKEYASRLSFLLASVSLLLFIPACLTESRGLRAFLAALIVALLCAGGVLLFLANRKKSNTVHYFLYDHRRNKLREREELTSESVQDSTDRYLRPFTEDPVSLFADIPKPLRLQLQAQPQFRPLVMYRMLYALSQLAAEDIYPIFLSADVRAISYLCRALSDCKDTQMSDHIYHLKKNAESEQERICSFFKKNAECFANRSLRYVERNFDAFYVEKPHK